MSKQPRDPSLTLLIVRLVTIGLMVALIAGGLYSLGFRRSLMFFQPFHTHIWEGLAFLSLGISLLIYIISSENLRDWHKREQNRIKRIEKELDQIKQAKYGYTPQVARYDFKPESADAEPPQNKN